MQSYFIKQLFDGEQLLTDVRLTIESGRIKTLTAESYAQDDILLDGLVVPGFVDIQVNGGGGVLLNTAPSLSSVIQMSNAHLQYGTTSMLPTVITDSADVMQQAADGISEALERDDTSVIGIHFEGPHLALAKRGIHSPEHIRAVNDQELAQFYRQDLGSVMLTVAPETVPTDVIKELTQHGVTVFLGHSNASADMTQAALEAGAKGFTHLYNAMSALNSREPGMVGVALTDRNAYSGLIVDHQHVHPLSVRLAIQCIGSKRVVLVTDAMAHVGSEQDTFTYLGNVITRKDNKLTLSDGTLAGSNLDMNSALKNTHYDLAVSLPEACQMTSSNAANLLGLEQTIGYLKPGNLANMLQLDEQLSVQRCWLKGNEQNI